MKGEHNDPKDVGRPKIIEERRRSRPWNKDNLGNDQEMDLWRHIKIRIMFAYTL